MKKWLSAIVLIVMLSQALPFNALAAIGHELTAEELAAAYTLTGFGPEEVRARSNAAYHKGMRPNATWNAMQVSDWLDDVLSTELFNVEDMLSRAGVAMARLKQSNPDAYDRLSGGDTIRCLPIFRRCTAMRRRFGSRCAITGTACRSGQP